MPPRSSAQAAAIHTLWDELSDFPAAQTDAALVHLMKTVCGWLRADDAVWIGGVRVAHGTAARRDPQHGWRGLALRRLVATPAVLSMSQQAMRDQDTDPGMTTRAITAQAGTFRVQRLRDGFLDFAAFRRTAHYRAYYEAPGITDRVWAAFPVNGDAESYFLFDRVGSKRRFSRADAALVALVLRGIKWFHRQLLLSHNLLLAQVPLSPMQRRMLFILLSDKKEKEIAAQLGFTPGTTHQYAVDLYRRFGVKGRAGLMALWLSA
jgi:DNA-binding CsgD family transcriptional regulator